MILFGPSLLGRVSWLYSWLYIPYFKVDMVGYVVGYIVISWLYDWLYYDGYVYITIVGPMYMSDEVGHIVGHNI